MPVMVRNQLGGFGAINFPGPNGQPVNPIWPYSEGSQWGDGSQGGAVPSQSVMEPPLVGDPPPRLAPQQLDVISTPYGQSTRPWYNPTTYAGFPILLGDSQTTKALSANTRRNSLIIQNTSTATAPDIAGTLYVGFNNPNPSQTSGSLALPPGLGFYWGAADCPPRDDIFVAFFGTINGGASVILSGSVIQGTYLPDAQQVNENAPPQWWQSLYGK
jgi:hypothetical protein